MMFLLQYFVQLVHNLVTSFGGPIRNLHLLVISSYQDFDGSTRLSAYVAAMVSLLVGKHQKRASIGKGLQ